MGKNNNEVTDKNYNVSYKKIFLIFGVTLFIILALAILFYVNLNKDTSKVVKGSIKYVSDDYIILKSGNAFSFSNKVNNKEYLIDMDDVDVEDKCEVGDELSLTIDRIKNSKDPIEAEAKNVKIISKAKKYEVVIDEEHEDDNDDDSSSANNTATFSNDNHNSSSSINEGVITNNNSTNTQQNNNSVGTEDDVISYFSSVNSELDRNASTKSLSESAKSGFVTVVDFLFYDKPIKGKTFKDLSNGAKLKVLKLGISIDKKIDSNFPDYKNTLSSKYQNVKSLAISKYLDKTAEVCDRNESTCQSARDGLSELKNNFSITWSFIKDISGVGLSKLNSWYEVWRQA